MTVVTFLFANKIVSYLSYLSSLLPVLFKRIKPLSSLYFLLFFDRLILVNFGVLRDHPVQKPLKFFGISIVSTDEKPNASS